MKDLNLYSAVEIDRELWESWDDAQKIAFVTKQIENSLRTMPVNEDHKHLFVKDSKTIGDNMSFTFKYRAKKISK